MTGNIKRSGSTNQGSGARGLKAYAGDALPVQEIGQILYGCKIGIRPTNQPLTVRLVQFRFQTAHVLNLLCPSMSFPIAGGSKAETAVRLESQHGVCGRAPCCVVWLVQGRHLKFTSGGS